MPYAAVTILSIVSNLKPDHNFIKIKIEVGYISQVTVHDHCLPLFLTAGIELVGKLLCEKSTKK